MQLSPSCPGAPSSRRRHLVILAFAVAALLAALSPPTASADDPFVALSPLCSGDSMKSRATYYGFDVALFNFPVDAVPHIVATAQRRNRPAEAVAIEWYRWGVGARREEPNFGDVNVDAFVDANGNGAADAGELSARATIHEPCGGGRAYLYDGHLRFFDYDEDERNAVAIGKLGRDFTISDHQRAPLRPTGACDYTASDPERPYSLCGPSQPDYNSGPPSEAPVTSVDVRTGGANDRAEIGYLGGPAAYMAGGRGADHLSGGQLGDTLVGADDDPAPGEAGDDPLDGADTLDGGGGPDTLIGNLGGDVLGGGSGDDYAYGDGGNDRISGDAGSDHLSGGSGNDTLISRDGVRDEVTCGPGSDEVSADWSDAIAADCERVDRGPQPPQPPQPPPPPPVTPPPPPVTPPATPVIPEPPADTPPATTLPGVPPPATTLPSVPPPQAGAPDTLAPTVSSLVRSTRLATLKRGKLKITVLTSEAAAIELRLLQGGTVIARGAAQARGPGGKTITLALTRGGRRKLQGLRRATFAVRGSVTDAAGNRRQIVKRVTLR